MRFPRNKIIASLENSLSSILNGLSLEEWIEKIASNLLEISKQTAPPVKINDKILNERRIVDILYKVNLIERGRLIIADKGFLIEINPIKKSVDQWYRVYLAHEIAHTFLYNLKDWPPKKIISYAVGNRELEWLCFQIARSLLVPKRWLQDMVIKLPQPGSSNFTLEYLNKLAKLFSIPWQIIGQRLIEDLGLWRCIILLFDNDCYDTKNKSNSWHLRWYVVPTKKTDKLFIPIGHKHEGKWEYPTAKGKLVNFIVDYVNTEKETYFKTNITSQIIKSSATGNLSKYLSDNLKKEQFEVYCAVKRSSFHPLFEVSSNIINRTQFIMCFYL